MKRTKGKTESRKSMRRLILYAMFFSILLFSVVGLAGLFYLSNSYYAEFARNQNELLESYYHYNEAQNGAGFKAETLAAYFASVKRLQDAGATQNIADAVTDIGKGKPPGETRKNVAEGSFHLLKANRRPRFLVKAGRCND